MPIDYNMFDRIDEREVKMMVSGIEQITKKKPLAQAQNYVDEFTRMGGLEFLKFFSKSNARKYAADYEKYVELKRKGSKALAQEREFVTDFRKRTEMAVRFCDALNETLSGIKSVGNILRTGLGAVDKLREQDGPVRDLTDVRDFLLDELEIDKLFK